MYLSNVFLRSGSGCLNSQNRDVLIKSGMVGPSECFEHVQFIEVGRSDLVRMNFKTECSS